MKNLPNSASRRMRGAALIAVLSLIVLMAALVTVFLVRTATERSASASYDAAAGTRMLAETTVNLVQATINQATSGTSAQAWASQPGAIRVFNNTGALSRIYRLYSGTEVSTATSSGDILANDIPPTGWASEPATWVDLNKPVTVSGTSGSASDYLVYPILDPRDPKDPGTATAPKVLADLDGFSITSAPGATTLQPAPMPVRWLYVLRDGQIVTPTGGAGTSVTVPGATSGNPITGRIAFWTDDETAKVNVNTAAGSFSDWGTGKILPGTWDTPRFRIWEEKMLFSENQPVKGEYQRYPGHPATTDLSGILKALNAPLGDYPYVVFNPSLSPQPSPTPEASGLFSLLPRFTDDNSSSGGSRNTTKNSPPPVINDGVPKTERLFSSVGELLYDPARNSNGLTRQQLESGKFFLTAQNRAPEVTLFGTPRVPMWPVNKTPGATTRTALDNLMAFCSTTGTGSSTSSYFIQRGNANSATDDYTTIQRNKDLFAYLKNLSSREIPGFGGSFRAKYLYSTASSNEMDQILTQMIDYIRCTNLWDRGTTVPAFTRFSINPSGVTGYNFRGSAVPLKIEAGAVTTSGLGRAHTISEIGVHIICTADGNSPLGPYQPPVIVDGVKVSPVKGSANDPLYTSNLPEAQYLRDDTGTAGNIIGWDTSVTPNAITTGTPTTRPASGGPFPANQTLTSTGAYEGDLNLQALLPGQKKLQAMLLFEVASPMMGFHSLDLSDSPPFKLNVSRIQGMSIAGQNPFPNRTSVGDTKAPNTNGNGLLDEFPSRISEQETGGLLGFRYLVRGRFNSWSGKQFVPGQTTEPTTGQPYRYVSNPFTVSTSTLTLGGGFRVELHVPEAGDTSSAYQGIDVNFPAVSNIPLPDLMKSGLAKASNITLASEKPDFAADWWGFDMRIRLGSGAIANPNNTNLGEMTNFPKIRRGAVIRADAPLPNTTGWKWQYDHVAMVEQPNFSNQGDTTKFEGSDVVRTLVARDGDYRLVAAQAEMTADGSTSSPFARGPGYDTGVKLGNLFKDHYSSLDTAGVDHQGKLVSGADYGWHLTPKVPSNMDPAKQLTWDWDSGLPWEPDGAYANKADEGNIYASGASPYYNRESESLTNMPSYFTANRIVNSPVMFGSLPSGALESISWRTLLFRPSPAANRPLDPAGPKDHLLLDLFWMPVVEPYAISEPFSTAGKVNMNYQIVPFTYIERSTGVRAVLNSELVARVPKAAAGRQGSSWYHTIYKPTSNSGPGSTPVSAGGVTLARLPIDLDETLKQFKAKFTNATDPSIPKDIFKSASEICDIYLVPEDPAEPERYTWPGFDATWYGDDFALVGDNVRERPYANIYPRLTTKSNTFTVHYTVQALKNPPGPTPEVWNESRGVVTGELRGSTTLERFLDPADSKIEDYATKPGAASLDSLYQWRVISSNTFAP